MFDVNSKVAITRAVATKHFVNVDCFVLVPASNRSCSLNGIVSPQLL